MNKISVFGSTGFIGGTFYRMFKNDSIAIPKYDTNCNTSEILYFVSTTTNQNIFNDLHIDINTNLNFLMDVLGNCKDKDLIFNFISSGFVYGNDVLDAKETDECNPIGFYSITKRCAEQLLICFCKTFNIKYRILRIGNVYGLDKTISPNKNVLGYMIKLLKEDKDINLYDNGDYLKDYIFVEDICYAIKTILDEGKYNEIYNISSGTKNTFRSIIEKAKYITKSNSNLINIPTPKEQEYIQVKNMTLNIDKLKNLNFSPKMEFETGLRMLCDIV